MFKPTVLALLVVAASASVAMADWPTFLGGDTQVSEFNPPIEWTPESNITWTADLTGHGQSSPIVIGDNVYITAVDGPMKESNLVMCYSLGDGSKKWEKSFPSSLQVKNDVYTSRAAPSPVADADGVYVFFESGDMVALSPGGDVRWERNLIDDYGKYEGRFGLGGSVAQDDKHLFVLADNDGPAYLAAFEKATGKTAWKTDRSPRISWSSPMMIAIDGKPQVVVSSAGSVDGYDPASGALLWTFDEVGGNTVASPIAAQNNSFLIGASPGRNGEESEGAKQSNLLMKVNAIDGENKYSTEVVWRNTSATSSFGSPLVYREYAYYTNRAGVVYCLDMATGETVYTGRLPESNWATPVGIGEHVFVFGKDGTTAVLANGPELDIVAENRLWTSTGEAQPGNFGGEIQYAVVPLANGFLVRTGSKLVRIGQ
ncbi:outer membrane protein assembly factor BamB family protein [Rubripirellula reticaptiva]|uniref:Outer membrane biogenesis protein BamB n=1 Tax=Rubripirellula reticaptiva TaxID=2528013 RepID=A0A5C6ETD4_9BACT|nr:PQQ-binding-like beta-propeller repeat protein [Rubripirellula reticaptiva]TWU51644.1 outer membrane biogenesis protein BamB [Rubripirellula reticaptiva]